MLPVTGAGRGRRPAQGRPGPPTAQARPRPSRGGRGDGRPGPGRDWWELNEEGTILRGERSGSSIRLGQPLSVRVERVEAIRGRVDLAPAG